MSFHLGKQEKSSTDFSAKHFQEGYIFFSFSRRETNIAMENHHFDGIYQERWGFSWAMLVSRRGNMANISFPPN